MTIQKFLIFLPYYIINDFFRDSILICGIDANLDADADAVNIFERYRRK